jgi:hypothetical protein
MSSARFCTSHRMLRLLPHEFRHLVPQNMRPQHRDGARLPRQSGQQQRMTQYLLTTVARWQQQLTYRGGSSCAAPSLPEPFRTSLPPENFPEIRVPESSNHNRQGSCSGPATIPSFSRRPVYGSRASIRKTAWNLSATRTSSSTAPPVIAPRPPAVIWSSAIIRPAAAASGARKTTALVPAGIHSLTTISTATPAGCAIVHSAAVPPAIRVLHPALRAALPESVFECDSRLERHHNHRRHHHQAEITQINARCRTRTDQHASPRLPH